MTMTSIRTQGLRDTAANFLKKFEKRGYVEWVAILTSICVLPLLCFRRFVDE